LIKLKTPTNAWHFTQLPIPDKRKLKVIKEKEEYKVVLNLALILE
jgi:hypothetical protein